MDKGFIELIESNLRERLSNTLLVSFVISWSVINYKFYVILFSDAKITETFKLINIIVFPDYSAILFNGVLYPILAALIYIFVYPIPERFVYTYSRKCSAKLLKIKEDFDNVKLIPPELYRQLKMKYMELESQYEILIERRQKDLDRAKTENESLIIAIQELKKGIPTLSEREGDKLTAGISKVLFYHIGSSDNPLNENRVLNALSETNLVIQHGLDVLCDEGLVNVYENDVNGLKMIELTKNGRTYFINNEKDLQNNYKNYEGHKEQQENQNFD